MYENIYNVYESKYSIRHLVFPDLLLELIKSKIKFLAEILLEFNKFTL